MKNVPVVLTALAILFFNTNLFAGQKRILNSASCHSTHSWASDCVEEMESVVSPDIRIEHHYMDTKRIPPLLFPGMATTTAAVR